MSLAVALRNNLDIELHIFEKSADFVPMAGAGMSVWPRTVSIFKKWGIVDAFKQVVTQSPVTSTSVPFPRQQSYPRSHLKRMRPDC